ncbi:MAG TPA: asparagine synthase (glutamine-hydrolyzing) [Vicinamibacterales bacterium]|nr:asparagine synthase (glutamine-hydrolyzing) [Vicinamibacterales bacterium]
MCGICGIVGRPDTSAVRRMTAAMAHRGPDDESYFSDERAALGFRRLAIIDVAGGRQPLSNEDGSIQVVFNGEIYNHRDLRARLEWKGHTLRSGSDGEVLSHLYEEHGEDLVDGLSGIFAFALWDRTRGRLMLARDPHGVKPLYYGEQAGRTVFASEIKALLASGCVSKDLDPEAVAQYLSYQAVPPPHSILRDVRALPPGRVAIGQPGSLTERCYWAPRPEDAQAIESPEEACLLVRESLETAVKQQLMTERPLGVFLSGGVDSSAIVAIAAQQVSHRLKTFSVGFVGPDETVLSEWPWAKLVSERYNTDHQQFVLTEDMFREALPHTLRAMDQPTSDGINSYWVSYAAAQHVTVALSGTGGDELFLGYSRNALMLDGYDLARPLQRLPTGYVRFLTQIMQGVSDDHLWEPLARLRRAAGCLALLDSTYASPRGIGIFDAHDRDAVLAPLLRDGRRFRDGIDYLRQDVPPDIGRPGDWLARLEQRGYLSFVLLRDIDAMSMAHSLEVRVPLLDRALSDASSRISWRLKLRGGEGKWVFKHALRDLLPDEVLFRPKMGFGLPYQLWMRRSLEPIVRDLLSPDRVKRRGVFDLRATADLVDRFYRGDDTVWRRVWTLFVLEGWASEVLDAAA